MKIIHDPASDFLSIDFRDEVEAKTVFQDGIMVRFDKKGQVIGLDITDSTKLFLRSDSISLQEACELLGVSESTLRRKIKQGKIPYTKPNGKDFRFKKSDILKLIA